MIADPPVPWDNTTSGNLAGDAAIGAFADARPAANSGRLGGPSHCGSSFAEASAGYQTNAESAWFCAPRQL
jgi:hypothetical protein